MSPLREASGATISRSAPVNLASSESPASVRSNPNTARTITRSVSACIDG